MTPTNTPSIVLTQEEKDHILRFHDLFNITRVSDNFLAAAYDRTLDHAGKTLERGEGASEGRTVQSVARTLAKHLYVIAAIEAEAKRRGLTL